MLESALVELWLVTVSMETWLVKLNSEFAFAIYSFSLVVVFEISISCVSFLRLRQKSKLEEAD